MSNLKAHSLGSAGDVQLSEAIFGESFHGPLVHEVASAELAARRQGTASTKTRGLVRGGGAKPWRQKGTGRARIGSIRAPHWTGGGTAFGPSPRHYTVKVNRKARQRALRAALSMHADRGTVAIMDASEFKEPSTSRAASLLQKWGAPAPVLIVALAGESDCAKSFRNLKDSAVTSVEQISVAQIVWAGSLVMSKLALAALEPLTNAATRQEALTQTAQKAPARQEQKAEKSDRVKDAEQKSEPKQGEV